jgi:hypothetical protein
MHVSRLSTVDLQMSTLDSYQNNTGHFIIIPRTRTGRERGKPISEMGNWEWRPFVL